MLNKDELIKSIEEALTMWNLVHQEHYNIALDSPKGTLEAYTAGYDGEAFLRLQHNLELLKKEPV